MSMRRLIEALEQITKTDEREIDSEIKTGADRLVKIATAVDFREQPFVVDIRTLIDSGNEKQALAKITRTLIAHYRYEYGSDLQGARLEKATSRAEAEAKRVIDAFKSKSGKATPKDKQIPDDLLKKFRNLYWAMNDDNIHQDGEASAADVRREMNRLKKSWADLERQLGRKIDEVELSAQYEERFGKRSF